MRILWTASFCRFSPAVSLRVCAHGYTPVPEPTSVPSHRPPPYDNNHHISGYNLFVSAYHGFAQLGNEHVPEPQPFPEFPSAALELLQITPAIGNAIIIRCRLTLTDTVHPERWHLSARIQLTAPGVGCDPSKMRSCMATSSGYIEIGQNTSSCDVTFTSAFCVISGPIQAHIKYRFFDEVTGYRNNWKKMIPQKCKMRRFCNA